MKLVKVIVLLDKFQIITLEPELLQEVGIFKEIFDNKAIERICADSDILGDSLRHLLGQISFDELLHLGAIERRGQ